VEEGVIDALKHGPLGFPVVDVALRLLRAGIEVDPTDEDRYVRAGEILHRHGRRGAARQILNDLDGVLDDLGLPPSARHRDLERSLSS
jgi:DNA-binding SARP family transcriptional activator